MTLSTTPTNAVTFQKLSTISLGGAEISAYDKASGRLFVTSSSGLQIVDLSNPAAPAFITKLDASAMGTISADIQSVAVKNGIVAAAVRNLDKSLPGEVVFLEASTGAVLGKVVVGANPDMVTFTPDGTKLLVANEGELPTPPVDSDGVADTNIDAEGSVSIISLSTASGFSTTVTTATFNAFDSQVESLQKAGVRLFAGVPATTRVSQDLEPEYIALSPDGTKALVTLQENNAVALLDIPSTSFTAIVPLGTKDFSTLLADFSDRDGPGSTTEIDLKTGLPVRGLYMPDAIASYSSGG